MNIYNSNNIQTNPSVGVVDQEVKLARLLLLDPLEQLLHLHDGYDDHDDNEDDYQSHHDDLAEDVHDDHAVSS